MNCKIPTGFLKPKKNHMILCKLVLLQWWLRCARPLWLRIFRTKVEQFFSYREMFIVALLRLLSLYIANGNHNIYAIQAYIKKKKKKGKKIFIHIRSYNILLYERIVTLIIRQHAYDNIISQLLVSKYLIRT